AALVPDEGDVATSRHPEGLRPTGGIAPLTRGAVRPPQAPVRRRGGCVDASCVSRGLGDTADETRAAHGVVEREAGLDKDLGGPVTGVRGARAADSVAEFGVVDHDGDFVRGTPLAWLIGSG